MNLLLQHFHVTAKNLSGVFIPKVKAVTLTILIGFAGCTFSGTCPRTVTHDLVSFIPNGHKIVGVDISLDIICP